MSAAAELAPQDAPELAPRERPVGRGRLFAALALAQRSIRSAEKDRENPHFRSSYATLASVWDACREQLGAHGVAVVQSPATRGKVVSITTTLGHASGEEMSSVVEAEARDASPQAIGSVITYLRRYSLASMVGVAPAEDDDDGDHGQRGPSPAQQAYEQRRASAPPAARPAPVPHVDHETVAAGIAMEMASSRSLVELQGIANRMPALPDAIKDELRRGYTAAKTRLGAVAGARSAGVGDFPMLDRPPGQDG